MSTPVLLAKLMCAYPGMVAKSFGIASGAPIPRGLRLRVTDVEHGVRNVSSKFPVLGRMLTRQHTAISDDRRDMPYCQIRFEVRDRFGRMLDSNAVITIDKERNRLVPPWSSWLWVYPHRLNIGEGLIVLPAMLTTMPVSMTLNAIRNARERVDGCSRHHKVMLRKLRSQLDEETYEAYRRAVTR